MINKTLALFLLALYLLASFRVAFPLMEYAVQYKYISTVLCENKAKPELNCCGKCYVKKKIAKAEETDDPTESSSPKERRLSELELHTATDEETLAPIHLARLLILPRTPCRLLSGFATLPTQPPEA